MLNKTRLLPVVLIGLIALTALPCVPSFADGKVILLIADRLVLSDLTESASPNISRMVDGGAIGLISANPGTRKSIESTYLSMGASSRMTGSASVYEGYGASETIDKSPALEIYRRRMGSDAPAGSVINPDLPRLMRINEKKRSAGRPGALGEALRRDGKRVAVFGNSDTMDSHLRPAVTVAMDAAGIVPEGNVGPGMLTSRAASPTGKVTHVAAMLKAVADAARRCDLIVVEFGDTQRVEDARSGISELAYSIYRQDAIARLDDLVGGLMKLSAGSSSDLILVSPLPPAEGDNVDRLSPIIFYPSECGVLPGRSLVSSASTRTNGLVSAVDVAPTILTRLQAPVPADMLGKPIMMREDPRRLDNLRWLDSLVVFHTHAELPVLGVIAGLGAFALTTLGLLVAFGVRPSSWVLATLRMLLLALSACPLAMLMAATWDGRSLAGYAAVLASISAALLVVVFSVGRILQQRRTIVSGPIPMLPGILSILTALILVVDVMTGCRLITYSLVSTYQLAGLRYYGIGNEYMGVLIGHGLLGLLWLRQQMPAKSISVRSKWLFMVASAVLVLVIGLPMLGANAGGEIAAVIGLGLCCKAILGRDLRWRDGLVLLLLSAILLGVSAIIDLRTQPDQLSHVGQAARNVDQSGWGQLYTAAWRKLSFNIGLLGLRHSETAVLGFLPFIMLWFLGIQQKVAPVFKRRPDLSNGFKAILAGAAAAFLFNDSGVVAASIILSVPMAALLYGLAGETGKAK